MITLIKRIDATICPTCKADVSSEKRECQHTNGYWNEYRTFTCGHVLHFSPNFKRVEVLTKCPNDVKEVTKREKREEALRKIKKYVNRLDVDDNWKDSVLLYLP